MKLEIGDYVKVVNLKDTGISDKSIPVGSYGLIVGENNSDCLQFEVNVNGLVWSFNSYNLTYIEI